MCQFMQPKKNFKIFFLLIENVNVLNICFVCFWIFSEILAWINLVCFPHCQICLYLLGFTLDLTWFAYPSLHRATIKWLDSKHCLYKNQIKNARTSWQTNYFFFWNLLLQLLLLTLKKIGNIKKLDCVAHW